MTMTLHMQMKFVDNQDALCSVICGFDPYSPFLPSVSLLFSAVCKNYHCYVVLDV